MAVSVRILPRAEPVIFSKTALFCLHCGAHAVWAQTMYDPEVCLGNVYYCGVCQWKFGVARLPEPSHGEADSLILEAISV